MYNIYIMTTVCCTREMHWRNRDSILCSYGVCVCVQLVGFDEKAMAVFVCVCDMTYLYVDWVFRF